MDLIIDAVRAGVVAVALSVAAVHSAHGQAAAPAQRSARVALPPGRAALHDRIRAVAREERIPGSTALALIAIESSFDTAAVGHGGPVGLMQIMPGTARSVIPGVTRKQLFQPETNVRAGLRYLRELMDHYDGDLELALRAYKSGPRAVDGGKGRTKSADAYIRRIMAAQARYERDEVVASAMLALWFL